MIAAYKGFLVLAFFTFWFSWQYKKDPAPNPASGACYSSKLPLGTPPRQLVTVVATPFAA